MHHVVHFLSLCRELVAHPDRATVVAKAWPEIDERPSFSVAVALRTHPDSVAIGVAIRRTSLAERRLSHRAPGPDNEIAHALVHAEEPAHK